MHKLLKLSCVLLLISTESASANEEGTGPYLTAGYNWFNFDSDRSVNKNEDDLFLGLGYQVSENIGIEGKYTDFGAKYYSFSALYRHQPRSENSFFWKLGLGRYSDFIDDRATFNLGAGYEAHFNKNLSMTVGMDSLVMFNQSYVDWVPYLGISYFFGNETSKPAPIPAKKSPKDTDRDGVSDLSDQCLNTVVGATVDSRGCELDSDGDGIVDHADQCQKTPTGAKVDAKGCRILLTEDVSIKLNVQFENNSNKVSNAYRQEIQKVADFMSLYPDTQVVIEGHTDSRGAASYNKRLSEKRATAVMQYLVTEFNIDQARVSAIGKGEVSPIADNETVDGRKVNRRVQAEIKTSVTKAQ